MKSEEFSYRYENIDWTKFDELFKESIMEICFTPIAKNDEEKNGK